MAAEYLEGITLHFQSSSSGFISALSGLLHAVLRTEEGHCSVIPSQDGFFPKLFLDTDTDSRVPVCDFEFTDHGTVSVAIQNSTDTEKQNPSAYRYIKIEEVISRFYKDSVEVLRVDHIGFNLPWFGQGLHPSIISLRKKLKKGCLYHCFPTGEPWDFILPGDVAEISNKINIDYNQIRKPKFEIVSFDKASTPLIQIDIAINLSYMEFKRLFPEALDDRNMKNIWIYIDNPCDIDICLVLNQYNEDDWSQVFQGNRLL